jgi:flagellar biosynthetic protein FlhB
MADDKSSKTEQPTAKRREKSREEGQVARSIEVNSAAVLLATIATLAITGPRLLAQCEEIMSAGLGRTANPDAVTAGGAQEVLDWAMRATASAAAPVVAAAALAGLLASVLQVGLKFTPKAMKPSLAKINLFKGLKRMVEPSQAVELTKSILKTVAVGAVAAMAVWERLPTMGTLVGMPPGQLLAETSKVVMAIAVKVVIAMIVIAALDYAWQRHRHEKQLKMSKDEVKKEAKESDLPPELRGQMRRRQSDAARKRMMADVPSADVVVVNPTHFAVALRYDGSKAAPEVVAKGVDHVALAIRRLAEDAGVTIVHEPPLARALYRDVEIGQMIPEELFTAVAEVLAFVFRTARRRRRVA